MELTPDIIVLAELGPLKLNATIVNTWVVMALLVGVSWLVTRRLRPDVPPGRLRNALEVLVLMIEGQIREIVAPPRSPAARGALALQAAEPPESAPLRAVQARAGEPGAAALSPEGADPAWERPGAGTGPPRSPAAPGALPPKGADPAWERPGAGSGPPRSPAARGALPPEGADPAWERPGAGSAVHQVLYFAGTLLLFIAAANLLAVIPGFRAPTGSLSTTVALTLAVLLAVPAFSMGHGGFGHWLRSFAQPSVLLLPFNILGEFSKAVSLAIRLYGNVMSGAVIVAILLTVAPFFFPVVMQLFGLLAGIIQAYIFAILAAVYISSVVADPHAKLEDKT